MLDQFINLVRESSQQAVVENPEIPNDQNEQIMKEAGASVMETLQSMMAGGNASQVLGLFGSNAADVNNNPVTQNASGNLINSLTQKLGINKQLASTIAAAVIPMILSKLVNRTNDSNDNGFNIQDIFNNLSGNKTSGINIPNILSKFGGGGGVGSLLDRDGDGDTDLNDLMAAFQGNSGANQQTQSSGGGGLLGQLKGLFGK